MASPYIDRETIVVKAANELKACTDAQLRKFASGSVVVMIAPDLMKSAAERELMRRELFKERSTCVA